jgi:uncharacterized protein YgbK (DUF1537 family)
MAEADNRRLAMPAGRAVVLAGSCSATTRGQVAAAKAANMPAFGVDPLAIAAGRTQPQAAVDFVLAQSADAVPVIYSSAEPDAVAAAQQALGVEKAGAVVEEFLAGVAGELSRKGVSRFLVAGGETSGAVVGALDIKTLEIGPEIDPGVPWTLARNGAGTPFALALKSGNFGRPDFFSKAWTLLP